MPTLTFPFIGGVSHPAFHFKISYAEWLTPLTHCIPSHIASSLPLHRRYSQEFKKLPGDTKPFSKTGGGYWFGQRKVSQGRSGPSDE